MPVAIQIFTLPDLTPIYSDTVDICTPRTYELNVGSYRVIGTYQETGEKKQADFTILEAQTTSVDLTFQPVAPKYWRLTISVSPLGTGTTNPSGIIDIPEGQSQAVSATPNSGYRFDHWTSDISGVNGSTANPITVPAQTPDTTHTLTAVFVTVPPPEYMLTIATTTGGTTSPTPGSHTYPQNTNVQVTGIPYTGYNFHHWLMDGIQYTSNPITVLMNANHTLTAYFSEIPPPPPEKYKLSLNATIGGTTDPAPGVLEYNAGETATVTAIPESGYKFSRWELDAVKKTVNPISVLMDKDHTLLAVFAEIPPPTKCFIATAAYGSPLAPQLSVLRRFRDRCLPNSIVGLYYCLSPPIAAFIRKHGKTRSAVRVVIDLLVKALKQ